MSVLQHKYNGYKRIALVGHGLGGLAIQRALVSLYEPYLKNISHVLLYATPSLGISASEIKRQDQFKWKYLSQEEPFIKNLRTQWAEKFSDNTHFYFKVVAGTNDSDITLNSVFEPFTQQQHVIIEGNHFSMIQPEDQQHDGYQLLISALTNTQFLNEFTNKLDVNLLLGEYDAVVKKLLPKTDALRARTLKQLIFALEGLDRNKEAMEVLNNYATSDSQSDIMGMLGGRYKRIFLRTEEELAGEKAIEYYKSGLELATKNGDEEQQYYHAINLVFLSLIFEEDKQEMRSYATIALACATKIPMESLWKTATIAEANLYLGHLDKAKKLYANVAESAGLCEKLSIYTNAYCAYAEMANVQEDDFTRFLKKKFLD